MFNVKLMRTVFFLHVVWPIPEDLTGLCCSLQRPRSRFWVTVKLWENGTKHGEETGGCRGRGLNTHEKLYTVWIMVGKRQWRGPGCHWKFVGLKGYLQRCLEASKRMVSKTFPLPVSLVAWILVSRASWIESWWVHKREMCEAGWEVWLKR